MCLLTYRLYPLRFKWQGYFLIYLIHLQNNINQDNKNITNLQEVQKEDITHYLELNNETVNILKSFIIHLKEKTIA